jgi:hypothetical protein
VIQWWTEIEIHVLLIIFVSPELGVTDIGKYRVINSKKTSNINYTSLNNCRIWGYHSSCYEELYLLEYDVN